eukprot:gene871-784_t
MPTMAKVKKSPKKKGSIQKVKKLKGKKDVVFEKSKLKPFAKFMSEKKLYVSQQNDIGPRMPVYKNKKDSGTRFPLVGFGTYGFKKEEALQPCKDALAKGYRLIDTAQIYENEKFVGQAIEQSKIPREELFITTKVWRSSHGYDRCKKSIMKSLRAMKLDYLDCVLIHYPGCKTGWPLKSGTTSPPNWTPSMRLETWRAMEDLQAEGKIKVIGVSNYCQRHIEEIINSKKTRVTPQVLQIELHPKQAQWELREFCLKHKILLQAYASLGQGYGDLLNLDSVKDIAKAHKKTSAQVLLKWAAQRGMAVCPKSAHAARRSENADLFSFELTEAELKRLDGENCDARFCWKGERPDSINSLSSAEAKASPMESVKTSKRPAPVQTNFKNALAQQKCTEIRRLPPGGIKQILELEDKVFDADRKGDVHMALWTDPSASGQHGQTEVCVKRRLKDYFRGGEEYWRRVATRMLNLDAHENMAELLAIYEDDEGFDKGKPEAAFYVVMERMNGKQGELLNFLITEQQVPERKCKRLMREILYAVDHLHARNIVHRDIKPENIMFHNDDSARRNPNSPRHIQGYIPQERDNYEKLKLLDFDTCLMKAPGDMSPSSPGSPGSRRRLVGTPGYIAPEGYSGNYGAESDLWSVGVILYILMAGDMPYDEKIFTHTNAPSRVSDSHPIVQAMRDNPPRWDQEVWQLFPMAKDLCQQLLVMDPNKRIPTARHALAHAWLAGSPKAGAKKDLGKNAFALDSHSSDPSFNTNGKRPTSAQNKAALPSEQHILGPIRQSPKNAKVPPLEIPTDCGISKKGANRRTSETTTCPSDGNQSPKRSPLSKSPKRVSSHENLKQYKDEGHPVPYNPAP